MTAIVAGLRSGRYAPRSSRLRLSSTDGAGAVRLRTADVGADLYRVTTPAHSGVAAGALFTAARWADAVDRIDVDAAAGMAALTVSGY
jgi:hypothetical protein